MLALLLPLALASDPEVDRLLDATDDIQRGASSHAIIEMYVKTSAYERTMELEAWSRGQDRSLVIIRAPAKDAGVATLKLDDNIWNYLPKIDRTMKVPAGMMSSSWMGSHFTNDDLVKESRLREAYDASVTEGPDTSADKGWEIALVPKPDAPVVWGKVVLHLGADEVPRELLFYDDKGALARTQRFEDVQTIDGRKVPMKMTLLPADKPGEMTRITYLALDLDADVPETTFSLQSLHP